jgi:MYXO-CTERM domain-containing protein
VNGSNVFQAGGTARIDNVFVNGTLVPAPGAAALIGLAGLVARRRRD